MAIFHLRMSIIGGGNSKRSAVGAAAYHRGEKLYDEHGGEPHDYTQQRGAVSVAAYRRGSRLSDKENTHDYTRKKGVVHSEIMLPEHALKEYMDSQTLWNTAQNVEKQHNARTAREIVIALPNELTTEQQIELVRDYVKREFVDKGMCVDFSIHAGHIHSRKCEIYPFKDLAIQKENPHVHIQLTVRPLNQDGTFCKTKTRKEYILDKNGERIRTKSGKGWVSKNVGLTDWDKKETLLKWRENWAVTVNKEFERLGIDERISHLSLEAQGINREPTKHMGHEAWHLEKKGIKTKIGNENRAIMARNKALEQLEKETPKHEPSTREKLTIIRNEQDINHESTTHMGTENTAEYMHELKQGYITVDKEVSEIQQEINVIGREKNVMQAKAEEIEERSEQIQALKKRVDELETQRKEMRLFGNKKAIGEQIQSLLRSHEQAKNYFKRTYNIAPEEATTEIKRIEIKIKDIEQAKERLQTQLPPLLVDREFFKLEYYKQKLLADISHDRQRILDRLVQIEKETRKNNISPKDEIARMRSETDLSILTAQEFEKILRDIPPEQREILIRQRKREKERERDKYRER